MSFTSEINLKGLVDLLNTGDAPDTEDDEYECDSSKNYYDYKVMNSTFCKTNRNTELGNAKSDKSNNYNKIEEKSKYIWDDDEILCEEEDDAIMKEKPEYEMVYEQSVTPNDVFLQLSGKGPGTDSCECLLMKIKLPGIHSKNEVNLDISALKLICKTRRYYLNLDLPKKVDPTKCSAKWDQAESILIVKLVFETESMFLFS